jgi:hypothetical protein
MRILQDRGRISRIYYRSLRGKDKPKENTDSIRIATTNYYKIDIGIPRILQF